MVKILFSIVFCLFTAISFAQEKVKVFPEQGVMQFSGLDDFSSPPAVKDGRASDIQNIALDSAGQASKRYGYSFHSLLDTNDAVDAFEAVTGAVELYKSTGTRTKIFTCGSKIFAVSTAGVKTDITSGTTITEGQNYQFNWAVALDLAIGTNFNDPPIKSTGTATSALSFTGLSSAITKAKCVIWWKNYLIFGNTVEGGTAHTTRIRWSNVGTVGTWSDNDYQDVATFGGQQIEAMATLYDDLYVFFTDSIYKVSLTGGDTLITVTKVSEGVGCIAKNSVKNIAIGNSEGIIFLSRDKSINFCDGVKVTDISTLISDTIDGLSQTRLAYATAIDDRVNGHYYLSVTDSTASGNNLILDYNYFIGEWSKHTGIHANAFCVANDANEVPQVYFGNYKSMVYQLQDSNKYSDVAGEVGAIDDKGIVDTATASGLTVLYDTSADFTDVTGATVTITSGTGVDEEYTIAATTSSGIVVVDATVTATGTSVYSIGAIEAYYTTKWYDMGIAVRNKNFGELFVWGSSSSSTTSDIYYATDFSSDIKAAEIVTTTTGSLWGTAIWGSSTWAGTATSFTRTPLNLSGRFIKIKFSNKNIDEPMDLYGYSIAYWSLDVL